LITKSPAIAPGFFVLDRASPGQSGFLSPRFQINCLSQTLEQLTLSIFGT
jgi:hypothetical protein